MKYKVIRNCHGFQNRYWHAGQVVDIPERYNPPHHFEPVGDYTPPEPEKLMPVAMSQLASGRRPGNGLEQSLRNETPEVDNKTLAPKKRRAKE